MVSTCSTRRMKIDLHISILNANGADSETLQLSSGKQANVTIVDVTKLWVVSVSSFDIKD